MSERAALLSRLASEIAAVRRDHPTRVGIDGVDCAGKTTLADELAERLRELGRDVVRASIDGFHNPARVRHRRGADSPEGYFRDSFDHASLIRELLAPLGPGGSRRYRAAVFDFRTDSARSEPLARADDDAVLVFDGVFLHRPELRDHWDYSIFLRASFEVTLERAALRDRELLGGASQVRERYLRRYVPGQQLYLSEVRPEGRASAVVDNDDPARPSRLPGNDAPA